MKFIRGYRVKYCHKHPKSHQGFKTYCFICGTDLYKTMIVTNFKVGKVVK